MYRVIIALFALSLLGAAETGVVQLPRPGTTYDILGVVPGLEKFAIRYNDQLVRGGQPLALEGAQAWQSWGIKTVFSIAPSDLERLLCEEAGITLIEIPFDKQSLDAATVARFLTQAQACEKPFFVHCHGGTHRGGALCLAWRLAIEEMPLAEALAEYEALGGVPQGGDQHMVETIIAAVANQQ